jgi:hypothetical protein
MYEVMTDERQCKLSLQPSPRLVTTTVVLTPRGFAVWRRTTSSIPAFERGSLPSSTSSSVKKSAFKGPGLDGDSGCDVEKTKEKENETTICFTRTTKRRRCWRWPLIGDPGVITGTAFRGSVSRWSSCSCPIPQSFSGEGLFPFCFPDDEDFFI